MNFRYKANLDQYRSGAKFNFSQEGMTTDDNYLEGGVKKISN
jgi:hypothetical protein